MSNKTNIVALSHGGRLVSAGWDRLMHTWDPRVGSGAQQTQRSGWRLSFDEAMGTQERPRREVSPEERLLCQRFCVGDSKKYGCRVCKPGLRLFNALSDADSQSGESEDGSGPSEQGRTAQQ